MAQINFTLYIWGGLKINVGSRELLWPTLIRLFSVVYKNSYAQTLMGNLHNTCTYFTTK
jgi:hypothetical protein